MIDRAPDATVFLSTAALIIGVFLTVVAAALASSLPEKLEDLTRPADAANRDQRYKRGVRRTLFTLLIANTLGTLFPFTLLLIDTVESIQSVWVWVVFSYSVCVIVINLGAVSAIYLGPFLARRRVPVSNSITAMGKISVVPLNAKPAEVTDDAFRNLSTRGARWHSSTGIAVGIAIGLLAGTRLKRTSK